MPRGVYPRQKKLAVVQSGNQQHVRVQKGYQVSSSQISVEPVVPTAHIETGSGGEIRYGVRAYGLTLDQASEDAIRVFKHLRETVKALKDQGVIVK